MPRIIQSITFLWLLAASHSAISTTTQIDYPLTRITDNIHVIYGPFEMPNEKNQGFRNNVGIIQTSKGVVICDPGGSASAGEMVVRKVKSLTNKPIVAVFNTHAHGDHWLGNEGIKRHYPQAVIYGHPTMKKKVEGSYGVNWVERLNRETKGKANGKQVTAPDNAVNHNDVITIGNTRFRIHNYGSAHTNNDIMIEVVNEKTLFTGDVVRNGMIGIMRDDSSFNGNVTSIDLILKKKFKFYIPGHGKAGNHDMPKTYQTYLDTIYKKVKEMYAQGAADFEMKRAIAKSVSKYKSWDNFDMLLGPNISRAYLEVEAEDFQ